MLKRFLLWSALSCLAAGVPATAQTPSTTALQVPSELPAGDRWLKHFNEDLLPFWDMPDAWGTPRGNFPTFRGNDGKAVAWSKPPEELATAPGWIKENFGREYVRMKSRQTYVYCVAYHLTGDPRMLRLARDGVTFIRKRALDPTSGSAVSYWERGVPRPEVLARTSQDLAYAELGMAMYYYLTRDEAVLRDIKKLKRHIFTQYWNPQWQALRWVVKGSSEDEPLRQELVAQLDQINAYMLLLTPILPEPDRKEWTADLKRLAEVMVRDYYDADRHLFWGTIHDPAQKKLGSRHTDFGHTAKAYWMIERIGRLTGDQALIDLATNGARALLKLAYLPDSGTWGSRLRPDGTVDSGKEWWIYAELDQLAETMALVDPAQAAPLPRTTDFWFRRMVDPLNHEVWGGTGGAPDFEPWKGPKIHQWKNGYHSCEHALVGYLTAQALHGQPATIYFALKGAAAPLRPYVFTGTVAKRTFLPLPGFPGRRKVAASFTALQ
jgi:mannose/cellobiose epimerase-like protein (N-acyl-D-glucosamine 2-epimerase family)